MKKFVKITSTVLAGVLMLSSVSVMPVSAAGKVAAPEVKVANAKQGVKVSWSYSKNAKKYTIYRKANGAKSFTKIKTVSKAGSGSYVDTTAKANKTYSYKVTASNADKFATSKAKKILYLKAVTVEDVTDALGTNIIWNKSKGATSYEIYRADITEGATVAELKYELYKTVKNIPDEWDSISDEDSIYAAFKVRAVKGKYKSAFSNIVRVNYVAAPEVYVEYSEDKANAIVQWEALNADDIAGYRVFRKPAGGEYVLLADIKAEAEDSSTYEYVDSTVPDDGQVYWYAVEAYVYRYSVKVPTVLY